jgi:hypothetical protein
MCRGHRRMVIDGQPPLVPRLPPGTPPPTPKLLERQASIASLGPANRCRAPPSPHALFGALHWAGGRWLALVWCSGTCSSTTQQSCPPPPPDPNLNLALPAETGPPDPSPRASIARLRRPPALCHPARARLTARERCKVLLLQQPGLCRE